MQLWLRRRNRRLPAPEQHGIRIGINYSTVVRLTDNVYGDMVNIAEKSGEDLAGKDEIERLRRGLAGVARAPHG